MEKKKGYFKLGNLVVWLLLSMAIVPEQYRQKCMLLIAAVWLIVLFYKKGIQKVKSVLLKTKSLQKRKKKKENPFSIELKEDLDTLLLRQVGIRITEKLCFSYPKAIWQWNTVNPVEEMRRYRPLYIATYNTGVYQQAEICFDRYGEMNMKLLKIVPLDSIKTSKKVVSDLDKQVLQQVISEVKQKEYQQMFVDTQKA